MEGPIEQGKSNKNEKILQLLSEISDDFNKTREHSVINAGFGTFTIDKNVMSEAALSLNSPVLKEMVKTLNPDEIIRKVKVVIDNDLDIGDALRAQVGVIVAAYLLEKNPSKDNLNRFTDTVLNLAEIKKR